MGPEPSSIEEPSDSTVPSAVSGCAPAGQATWPAPLGWDPRHRDATRLGDVRFTTDTREGHGPYRAFRIIDDPRRRCRPIRSGDEPPFELDSIGTAIWELLDGSSDLGVIADDLADVIGADAYEQLEAIVILVDRLAAQGAIVADTWSGGGQPVLEELEVDCDFRFTPFAYNRSPDGVHAPTSRELLLAAESPDGPGRAALAHLVDTIRTATGPGRTVWGVKRSDGRFCYEFYWYRIQPDGPGWLASVGDRVHTVFEALGWHVPRTVSPHVSIASIEVHVDEHGHIEPPTDMDLYGPSVSVLGRPTDAIFADDDLTEGTQYYHRYDLPEDRALLVERLDAGRFVTDDARALATKYWLSRIDAAARCESVFCTYKSHADGIYLAHVHANDLQALLDEFGYPDHLRAWFAEHIERLGDRYFDLEFDYTVDDGDLVVHKTGFFGSL